MIGQYALRLYMKSTVPGAYRIHASGAAWISNEAYLPKKILSDYEWSESVSQGQNVQKASSLVSIHAMVPDSF